MAMAVMDPEPRGFECNRCFRHLRSTRANAAISPAASGDDDKFQLPTDRKAITHWIVFSPVCRYAKHSVAGPGATQSTNGWALVSGIAWLIGGIHCATRCRLRCEDAARNDTLAETEGA